MFGLIRIFGVLTAAAALTACNNESTKTPDLAASVTAPQPAAPHLNDESLSCEIIQKEFIAVVTDPAVQSYVSSSGVLAQNAEWAQMMAAAESSTPIQQARMAERSGKQIKQMSELAAKVMPQVLRAQHLAQLSAEKRCAWSPHLYTSGANDSRH